MNDEIRVLRETGCYADFTYPSAPGPTQPPTINTIYYATGRPDRPRGHDRGVAVGRGPAPEGVDPDGAGAPGPELAEPQVAG